MSLILIGVDMAFANMGLVRMRYEQHDLGHQLKCLDFKLVQTSEDNPGKVVRKSSTELRRAKELREALYSFCMGADYACVEVPSGSQSASAARALGIAVGVLASCPIPILEVSPKEVKLAALPNIKNASKAQMITWATERWPDAPWLTAKSKGVTRYINDNEHLADACAAVCAGINTEEFKRLLAWGKQRDQIQPPARLRLYKK